MIATKTKQTDKKVLEPQTTMRVYPRTVTTVRKVAGFMGKSYAEVLDIMVEREGTRLLKKYASEVSKN